MLANILLKNQFEFIVLTSSYEYAYQIITKDILVQVFSHRLFCSKYDQAINYIVNSECEKTCKVQDRFFISRINHE